jgi:arylsulfatase A-like enzyme
MTENQNKNVIFIMLDSLQFNYLGCYGNDWIKTPNLDRFATQSTLFENAYTEGLPTIPCRRAMLTGRFTLPFLGWGPLTSQDSTIADLLWGRGIQTALIYDSAPMRLPKYGFSRGFDYVEFSHGHELDHTYYSHEKLYGLNVDDYFDDNVLRVDKEGNLDIVAQSAKEEVECYLKLRQHWRDESDNYVAVIAKNAMTWLDEKADRTKPFMLWVDSFDPHEPWDPPSVWDNDMESQYNPGYEGKDQIVPIPDIVDGLFTEDQLHHIRMLYAENVTLCDRWVGKILAKVKELGLWDNTMIIVTSDHGEPMGNGEHGHGIMRKCRPWPYEELAHIPMLVRVPGAGEGKRISSFVQSCDIAPTILDYLGYFDAAFSSEFYGYESLKEEEADNDEFQGKSLIPLVTGKKKKLRDFAIAGYYGFSWSIITKDYSYIHWLSDRDNDDIQEIIAKVYDGVGGADGEHYQSMQTDDMWTCTPASEAQLPEKDELYDRKKDQFQLNNIIDKKPKVAKKLLKQLKEYIGYLRTT